MPDLASEYVAARTVLLDAIEALGSQREAIIVVGAQAVYLRTGDAGITGVAPYTTDADLALAPARLADEPHIETLLGEADFEQKGEPGVWWKTVDIAGNPTNVEVDIMVPERYAPTGGRRSVRLPPHDKMVARKAIGLEGSMDMLVHLFGARGAEGVRMAIDALRVAVPAERVAEVCVGFVREVRATLDGG